MLHDFSSPLVTFFFFFFDTFYLRVRARMNSFSLVVSSLFYLEVLNAECFSLFFLRILPSPFSPPVSCTIIGTWRRASSTMILLQRLNL